MQCNFSLPLHIMFTTTTCTLQSDGEEEDGDGGKGKGPASYKFKSLSHHAEWGKKANSCGTVVLPAADMGSGIGS